METVRHTIAELAGKHHPVIVIYLVSATRPLLWRPITADLVLIPLKPDAVDVRVTIAMADLVRELNETPEQAKSRPSNNRSRSVS